MMAVEQLVLLSASIRPCLDLALLRGMADAVRLDGGRFSPVAVHEWRWIGWCWSVIIVHLLVQGSGRYIAPEDGVPARTLWRVCSSHPAIPRQMAIVPGLRRRLCTDPSPVLALAGNLPW